MSKIICIGLGVFLFAFCSNVKVQEPSKVSKVGWLSFALPEGGYRADMTRRALNNLGYIEGKNNKMLRAAFAEMAQDRQFLKEAEKIGLEIGLTRGEDMNRDIESTVRDKELMALYKTIMTAQ